MDVPSLLEKNNNPKTYFSANGIRDPFEGSLCWVLRHSLTSSVLQDHPHVCACGGSWVGVCYQLQFPHCRIINNEMNEHFYIIIGILYIVGKCCERFETLRRSESQAVSQHPPLYDLNRSSVCNVTSYDDSIGWHIWVLVACGLPEDPFSWLRCFKADLDGLLLIIYPRSSTWKVFCSAEIHHAVCSLL